MAIPLETKQNDIFRLSEGNPGAAITRATILMPAEGDAYNTFIQRLDELGYRGPDIWVAFKNFAQQNGLKFGIGLLTRDPEMQDIVDSSRR